MTVRRLLAIAVILIGTSAGWTILGSSLIARTGRFDGRLEPEVQLLWGGPHRQVAPNAWILRPGIDTETVETKDPDGRVVRREVTKPVVQRVPVALDQTRAKPCSTWSTGARGCSGTRPTRWRSKPPTGSPTRTGEARDGPRPVPAARRTCALRRLRVHAERPADRIRRATCRRKCRATCQRSIPARPSRSTSSTGREACGTWTYAFVEDGVAQVRDFTLEHAHELRRQSTSRRAPSRRREHVRRHGWSARRGASRTSSPGSRSAWRCPSG